MSIECIGYKKIGSGSLQGFANFSLPKMSLEIFGCGVFMKDGKRWISMPSREYKDGETGENKYIPTIRFVKAEHFETFRRMALDALDKWCAENAEPSCEAKPGFGSEGETPF